MLTESEKHIFNTSIHLSASFHEILHRWHPKTSNPFHVLFFGAGSLHEDKEDNSAGILW